MCVWVPLASLVSYRVSDYPMGALIELDTLLIVSLKEGKGEGRKGEQSGAARLDNFCRAGDTGEWCRYLHTSGFQLNSSSLSGYLHVFVDIQIFRFNEGCDVAEFFWAFFFFSMSAQCERGQS